MKGISPDFIDTQWQVLLVCLLLLGDNASVADVWCDVGFRFQTIVNHLRTSMRLIKRIRLSKRLSVAAILGAAFVGAKSLAVSGALAQRITQNPLADSGLLGINAGGWLGAALVFCFPPSGKGYWWLLVVSFLGAGVSVALIYYLSNHSNSEEQAPCV